MMNLITKDDYSLREIVDPEVKRFLNLNSNIQKKSDGTWITDLDINLSNLFKKEFQNKKPDFSFYSEEDFRSLIFPSIVVDPIDGTKGLVDKTYESAVSVAIMKSCELSCSENQFFIYCPFNLELPNIKNNDFIVSRSEYDWGMYQMDNLSVVPIGSIALKLLILAKGMGGGVISKRPKNIWDIAAGTQLLYNQGYSFFSENKEIFKLDKKLYYPPLIWGKKEFLKSKKLI